MFHKRNNCFLDIHRWIGTAADGRPRFRIRDLRTAVYNKKYNITWINNSVVHPRICIQVDVVFIYNFISFFFFLGTIFFNYYLLYTSSRVGSTAFYILLCFNCIIILTRARNKSRWVYTRAISHYNNK